LISLSRLRAAERLTAQTDAIAAEAEGLAASVRQSAVNAQAAAARTEQQDAPDPTPHLAPDLALNIRELDLAAAKARATASGRVDEAAAARAELARVGVDLAPAMSVGGRIGGEAGGTLADDGPASCLSLGAALVNRAGGPQ